MRIEVANNIDNLILLNRVGMYMIENGYTATYYKRDGINVYVLNVIEYGGVKLSIEYIENDSFNIYNIDFDEELLGDIVDIINRDADLEY